MESFDSIGKILQQKREAKNISLDLVAQKTKININILRHLESDELDKLPNKTYVKGFVSNYARTIGWDQNEAKDILMQTYQHQAGETEEPELQRTNLGSLQGENQVAEENDELKETFISIIQSFFNKKIFISVGVILVVMLIGKGIASFFSQLNYEHKQISSETPLKPQDENILEMKGNKNFAEQNITSDTQNDDKEEKLADESPAMNEVKDEANIANQDKPSEEKTDVAVKLEAETIVQKSEEEETEEEEVEKEPVPQTRTADGKFPYKNFYQAPLNTFEIVKDSPEASDPNLLPENIRRAMVEGKQNVYLRAVDGDTWIAYQADDEPIKKYILREGRSVLIRGDVVKIFMGNYNVAKVFYNNQLINAYTRTGVKSLIFPQGAGKDLKLPLFPTFQGRSYTSAEYIEKMAEKKEI